MKEWKGWIVRVLTDTGAEDFLFADSEEDAKAKVAEFKAKRMYAHFWEL